MASYSSDGKIDTVFHQTREWEDFYMKNLNIYQLITDLFADLTIYDSQELSLSTELISKNLNTEPKYIHQALAIWKEHSCTFYKKYGLIIWDPVKNLWTFKSSKVSN